MWPKRSDAGERANAVPFPIVIPCRILLHTRYANFMVNIDKVALWRPFQCEYGKLKKFAANKKLAFTCGYEFFDRGAP